MNAHVDKIAIADRESWLAMRMQDVTASDIGALCGVDPRRSPLRVYAEKTGLVGGTEENAVMRKGRWLEAAILSALKDERPDWEVRKAEVYLRDAGERIGATPDFVATAPDVDGLINIQGKVVARPIFNTSWRASADDEHAPVIVPLPYQLQTLTEAKLMNAAQAYVAALVHDAFTADLYMLPIDLHDGAWQRVRGTVKAFWTDVAAGRQPPVTPEVDGDLVKALYAKDDGETVDLTADNEILQLLDEREALADQVKTASKRKDALDTAIRAKLGPATFASVNGWRVKCAVESRSAYSVKASEPRVLRIKKL